MNKDMKKTIGIISIIVLGFFSLLMFSFDIYVTIECVKYGHSNLEMAFVLLPYAVMLFSIIPYGLNIIYCIYCLIKKDFNENKLSFIGFMVYTLSLIYYGILFLYNIY